MNAFLPLLAFRSVTLLACLFALAPLHLHGAPEFYHVYMGERLELQIDDTQLAVRTKSGSSTKRLPTVVEAMAFASRFNALGIRDQDAKAYRATGWMLVNVAGAKNNAAPAQTRKAQLSALVDEISKDSDVDFVSPVFTDAAGYPVTLAPQLLLGFTSGASDASKQEVFRKLLRAGERETLGRDDQWLVPAGSRNGFALLDLANELATTPGVRYAEPDFMFVGRTATLTGTNASAWALYNTGTNTGVGGGTANIDLNAFSAWTFTTGASGVKVLVMDSGIDMAHPALPNIAGGKDFTSTHGNPEGSPVGAFDNHGTLVAGCIAGYTPSTGAFGIAPGVSILSARIGENYDSVGHFDTNTLWYVQAIYWGLTQGARITVNSNTIIASSSITVAYTDTRGNQQLTTLPSMYSSTHAADMIHFVASGNDTATTLPYPANLPSVNSVGAIDSFGVRWSASNYGTGLTFVAPGKVIATTDRTGSAGLISGDYVFVNGTSLAAPFAAGVAALILSENPSWTATAVEMRMKETARDLGPTGYDTEYGNGMPDAGKALDTGDNGLWQAINLSVRAQVKTGAGIMIVGFVLTGTGSKTMLLRGVGPTLGNYGVAGSLNSPNVALYQGGTQIAGNAGWNTATNASDIRAAVTEVGAFPLPEGSADSSILASLAPGAYTAQVSGVNNSTGIALAEIYDASKSSSAKLVNQSCRIDVGMGDQVLIAGFVVLGNKSKSVMFRGVGPTLASYGVPGCLANPKIRLVEQISGATVAENDDWNNASNANIIRSFASTVGAFALVENSQDAAILLDVAPGIYSVVVEGVNSSTGNALVEMYVSP
jgi:subtilisin family serine protease